MNRARLMAMIVVGRVVALVGTPTAAAQTLPPEDGLTTVGIEFRVTTPTARALNEGREAFSATGSALAAERDRYVRHLEEQLRQWQPVIEEWKAWGAATGAQARAVFEREWTDFAARHQDLARKLDELQTTSSLVWKDLKAGTDEAAESLGRALERAREHF